MFSYVSRLYLHTETCLIPFIFSSLMMCDGVSLYWLHFTAQHPHFNYPLLHPSLLRFWVEGRRRVGEEERRRRGNKEEIEGRIEKEGKNCKKGGVGWLWVEWMGGLFWARRGEESEGRMQSRALTVFVHKWADNGSFNTWHKCWFLKKKYTFSYINQWPVACHVWHLAGGCGCVTTWLVLVPLHRHRQPSFLYFPQRRSATSTGECCALSLLPSLTCLVKGWATTTQLHIHFTQQPASQPCQWGSPPPHAPHPLPALLPSLSYFCNACPRPPSPSLPDVGSNSSFTPFTPPISLSPISYPYFTLSSTSAAGSEKWAQRDGDGGRAGARVLGGGGQRDTRETRRKTAWNSVKCEGRTELRVELEGGKGFFSLDGEQGGESGESG